jgi:hypothetical protein
LVLDGINKTSSLVASLSKVAELLEGRVDIMGTNGVCWGAQSTLVAVLLHFPELKTELGLLGSGRNMNLIEDEANALWTWMSAASDLLASNVSSSVAHGTPGDAGE